jgi:nucleotide-binding universal stress UspA family protein
VSEKSDIKKIVIPLDGSDSSFQAAEYAVKIAKLSGAKLILTHAVVSPPYVDYTTAGIGIAHYIEEARKQAETWYAKAGEMASKEGIEYSSETLFDVASVVDTITTYAESKNANLIVIGTHGRTGLKRFLLGSVASGVVAHAKCPVLVVR